MIWFNGMRVTIWSNVALQRSLIVTAGLLSIHFPQTTFTEVTFLLLITQRWRTRSYGLDHLHIIYSVLYTILSFITLIAFPGGGGYVRNIHNNGTRLGLTNHATQVISHININCFCLNISLDSSVR